MCECLSVCLCVCALLILGWSTYNRWILTPEVKSRCFDFGFNLRRRRSLRRRRLFYRQYAIRLIAVAQVYIMMIVISHCTHTHTYTNKHTRRQLKNLPHFVVTLKLRKNFYVQLNKLKQVFSVCLSVCVSKIATEHAIYVCACLSLCLISPGPGIGLGPGQETAKTTQDNKTEDNTIQDNTTPDKTRQDTLGNIYKNCCTPK